MPDLSDQRGQGPEHFLQGPPRVTWRNSIGESASPAVKYGHLTTTKVKSIIVWCLARRGAGSK